MKLKRSNAIIHCWYVINITVTHLSVELFQNINFSTIIIIIIIITNFFNTFFYIFVAVRC